MLWILLEDPDGTLIELVENTQSAYPEKNGLVFRFKKAKSHYPNG
jgi:hypothetical protein